MAAKAPEYGLHREGISALDASNETNKKAGVNFAGQDQAFFQVIPSGGANPTVEVLVWSEAAGEFIQANAPATFTGLGADRAYEFTVSALGRILWVKVTGGTTGNVDIYASGRTTSSIN